MSHTESLEYLPNRSRSCFVYGCFSTAANKPYLGFHKFPVRGKRHIVIIKKNGDKCIYDRRQLWIEAVNIGREASLAIDGVDIYVCSLHFARDDFYYNQDITGRRYLKENAIPRRNLPAHSKSALTTKFNVRFLNRIRYRGYFNIHNPDGRKLTAPRRFLGANNLKDATVGQLYTKTVWVVRKPIPSIEPSEQDGSNKDAVDNISVSHSFSLVKNSQIEDSTDDAEDYEQYTREEAEESEQCTASTVENDGQCTREEAGDYELCPKEEAEDDEQCTSEEFEHDEQRTREEAEEDEQCTILDIDNSQQNNNPWFTSELIIKEEPLSDSDQESSELIGQKAVDTDCEVSYDAITTDNEDTNYEPNNLIKQTEEEEENIQIGEQVDAAGVDESELSEDLDFTDIEELELSDIEENPSELEKFKETKEETIEYFQNNKETVDNYYEDEHQEHDYNVTSVQEEDATSQEDSDGKLCHICGEEYCEGHPMDADPDENYFVCLICSEMFPSQKQLAIHSISHQDMSEEELRMHEERTRSLTCEFCGRILSTKATLREHIMIHTGEKPHECMLCGKSFRHKANLVVHVNGHAVVSTYKCKKCNKAFTKKMDFEKHLMFHVDSSGNPLVCKICNAVFKSQRTLYNHAQLHSRKGMVRAKKRSNGPRDAVHVCNTCGKVLSTKATLKEHMMIHSGEKPHVCTICGRTIRHKANFVVHIQTHGQGKSYECDMCDEAFMRKSDLTQHKQLSHSKSKLLRCPICSEVFKSPQKFNRHMEIHESVVYMNETEELTGFEPHLLEGFLET